jgi:hypothetical protein
MKYARLNVLAAVLIVFSASALSAEPAPGDVFREYVWSCAMGNPGCNCGGNTFRVGYQNGAQNPTTPVNFAASVDIADAIKAEVILEVSECHTYTRDLQMSVNGGPWINVTIPIPDFCDYEHFYFPVTAVPISQVKAGTNTISLKVNTSVGSPWPQLLYSGAHLRVYYDPAKKPHVTGSITSPASGSEIGKIQNIVCTPGAGAAKRVDFIGYYEGVNWEGDGRYTQWHYIYFHGVFQRHIGTDAIGPDYSISWNTEWVPNQPAPFKLAARITGADSTIYMTPAVDNLTLCRPDLNVELCKITTTPKDWVTRNGTKSESFSVAGSPLKIIGAMVYNVGWGDCSPTFSINGVSAGYLGGGGYDFNFTSVAIAAATAKTAFKTGANTLTVNAAGEHGHEVMYPGPMPVVQYSATNACSPSVVKDRIPKTPAKGHVLIHYSHDAICFSTPSNRTYDISLMRPNGTAAGTLGTRENGTSAIGFSDLANGIYLAKVKSGRTETIQRISIMHKDGR